MGFGGQKLLKNNFKVLERQESAKSETLIFYIKSLRCKKKKLALTSIYYITREIWLDNSKKLICINESRFHIFSHPYKFKNV